METKRVLIDEKTGERFLMEIKKLNNKHPKYNVAFVVGHHNKAKGFHSPIIGDEYDFWFYYAQAYLKKLGKVFLHNENNSSYSGRQVEMAEKTKDFDLVFELHFNAHNEHAEGAHAMYYAKSTTGRMLAFKFTELMQKRMNIEQDYNFPVSSSSTRGGQFILKQKPTALLLEPFFADNENDVNKFINNKEVFYTIIEDLIKEFYKIK